MAAENIPKPAGDSLFLRAESSHLNGIQSLRVIVLRHDSAIVVVYVAGELDLLTATPLQNHLDKALATRPPRLIVDLSEVSFMSAIGLTVLITAHHAASDHGTTLQLRGVSRAAARVLHITELTSLFEISPTVKGPAD